VRANFLETNPIPVKTALELMGHGTAHFRPPLCEMSAAAREQLRETLEQTGINVSAAAESGRAGAPVRAGR
jgi:4-hydroxy-tetrahydrodipicolinate synthase